MVNTINTGSLDTLKFGQTLLVNARKIDSDDSVKISLQFAEIIRDQEVNLLEMLNEGDDRFSRRPRRAWMVAEPEAAAKYFGIDVTDDSKYYTNEMDHVVMDLNVLNPTINGQRVRVQITEQTTPPSDWAAANKDRVAKRKGKGGDLIKHNGKHIFTKSEVVLNQANHTFLEADSAPVNIPSNVDTDTGEIFS